MQAGYNAFEYSVGVGQGDTFGGAGGGPAANILPCDGTRHRVAVNVFPEAGAYKRGWAEHRRQRADLRPGDGSDIDAGAGARVWLKR